MSVTRANVEFCKRVFSDRLGVRYVYGGNWDPFNKGVGTDCSGLVGDCLDAVNMGPAMPWRRSVSTESWGYDYRAGRPVAPGTSGPKGTIAVASLADVPADAAVIVNIHHGGGGASSHTQCIVDGIVMESNGSHGTCTRRPDGTGGGMDPQSNYWTDHWYLPGPILEDGTEPTPMPAQDTTTWGIDISNHQGVMDLDQVKAEGFSFVWAKVSEGANYRDPFWPRTRDDAKRLGLILAGYHYVRDGDPAAQARVFVDQLGDKSIPAMLDFEANSGDMDQFWAVKAAIEQLGVAVRLSYIPDWYWEQIGRPDLSKVPGLIRSEYVAGAGYASVLYPGNDSPLWGAYGGRAPDILQFTDKALVAGKSIDANAFRGTPDQLRALLSGKPTTIGEDDFMSALTADEQREVLNLLRVLAKTPFPSRSPLRRLGEGPIDTIAGIGLNEDGNVHVVVSILLGLVGDPNTLDDLHEVATADLTKHPDRAADKVLATRILIYIATTNPAVLQANGVPA